MKHGSSFKVFIAAVSFSIFCVVLATGESKCPDRKTVVCYWASWSVYRPGDGKQNVGHIMPEYCTHIVYSFAGLDIEGKIQSLDPTLDIDQGTYEEIVGLRERDASGCLKILLAIGGWSEGSEKYSLMAESKASREAFADSVLQYLVYYGFDGIDIDWEYPTQRRGLAADQQAFTELLKTLKRKLAPRNRILSAAVTGSVETTKLAYEAKKICAEVDFISIMGYDFHETNVTSIHSPLKAEPNETRSTISDTVSYYKKSGCPAEKIILGVPAYGRTYTLKDAKVNKVGSPVAGLGKAGEFTGESGFLGFNEISELQRSQAGWKKVYLKNNTAVYAYNGKMWVSYDDEQTLEQKAEYVLKEGLGGMMMWSIDTDDFRKSNSPEAYPLLRAINRGLKWDVQLKENEETSNEEKRLRL